MSKKIDNAEVLTATEARNEENHVVMPEVVDNKPLVQINTAKLRRYWKASSRYVIGGAAVVAGAVLYGIATSNRATSESELLTATIQLRPQPVDDTDAYAFIEASHGTSSNSEESLDTDSESSEA